MSGTQRCDEIMRAIDEALAPFGEGSSRSRAAAPAEQDETDRKEARWARLVRWGAVPRPVVAAGG